MLPSVLGKAQTGSFSAHQPEVRAAG
jgi:hypothetical protein